MISLQESNLSGQFTGPNSRAHLFPCLILTTNPKGILTDAKLID